MDQLEVIIISLSVLTSNELIIKLIMLIVSSDMVN